jgi:thiol-disulfide isomerase/thioredoxin
MKPKTVFLLLALAAIVASIAYLQSLRPGRLTQPEDAGVIMPTAHEQPADDPRAALKAEKAMKYGFAREIVSPAGFINVPNITIAEHIGRDVILVDFWTYSCINCQRTLPYLNAWHQKYKDKGLVIIGVHSPEFAFEKRYENVLAAVGKFGVRYPVVLDNEFGTWQAYRNRYWPRKYLIDSDGYIVYDHIGEGAYGETERRIQELLEERARALGLQVDVPKDLVAGLGKPPPAFPLSPEVYFGAARNRYLANGVPFQRGLQSLREPSRIHVNELNLVGDWEFDDEFAENKAAGARVLFQYDAKDVFLVAEARADDPDGVRIRIRRDGQDTGDWAGADVVQEDGASFVTVKESVLYRLVQDKGGYGTHLLEIIAEEPGLRAFTFTFG